MDMDWIMDIAMRTHQLLDVHGITHDTGIASGLIHRTCPPAWILSNYIVIHLTTLAWTVDGCGLGYY
jgi:hypothetical protein